MALGDRELVKTSLAATEQASIDAAQSPQSMAGYMARLTAHLLKKVNNLTAEPVAGVAPTAPPAFVSASPASLFADNQFGAMGDVNSLFGSSLMAHQMVSWLRRTRSPTCADVPDSNSNSRSTFSKPLRPSLATCSGPQTSSATSSCIRCRTTTCGRVCSLFTLAAREALCSFISCGCCA